MTPDPRIPPASGSASAADDEARQWISDLADGRLDGPAVARGCADFAREPACRATWHAYHLIGDVLRSEALAQPPARDASLLAAVRARLADEPAIVAPAPVPDAVPSATRAARQARVRAQLWRLPLAAAAGVVAVAGVLVVLQQAGAGPGGPAVPGAAVLADGRPAGASPLRVAAPATDATAARRAPGATVEILRDARVDEYLRAHRETLVGTPAALPGGVVRSVEFTAPPR